MVKKENNEKRIYFDWAASAPYNKNKNYSDDLFGNPSSSHAEGRIAKQALEDARDRVSRALNVSAKTLFFTSGGTESNSVALFTNLTRPGKGRILYSKGEHASIREGINTLAKMGKPVGAIAIDPLGIVTDITLEKTLSSYDDARFAAIMSVNNETGAITDIKSLKKIINNRGGAPLYFHCDIAQAIGKIPVDLSGWEVDSASLSAHKIGGPRGIGLLYSRKPLEVFYSGGGQENGVRGGTENTQGAVMLADCLEQACSNTAVNENFNKAKERFKKLITELKKIKRCALIPAERTSDDERFSPYILQAAFKDIPGEVMARALDDLGFAVSTGSACSSSSPERPVLAAMGIEDNLSIEGIRISQGYSTTDEDIELLLAAINEVLKFL
ncbi:MAG: aminotransferase class V-fold PLP-dependent enzyme [Treponema sp.]|nr:aminotransferase class V-fold PLP-dependent enzyme [Treponema sp.]